MPNYEPCKRWAKRLQIGDMYISKSGKIMKMIWGEVYEIDRFGRGIEMPYIHVRSFSAGKGRWIFRGEYYVAISTLMSGYRKEGDDAT